MLAWLHALFPPNTKYNFTFTFYTQKKMQNLQFFLMSFCVISSCAMYVQIIHLCKFVFNTHCICMNLQSVARKKSVLVSLLHISVYIVLDLWWYKTISCCRMKSPGGGVGPDSAPPTPVEVKKTEYLWMVSVLFREC